MSTIEQSIELEVPVRAAYNQWTQFEEFPSFMEGVVDIRQTPEGLRAELEDDGRELLQPPFGTERHGLPIAQVGQVGGVARQAADLGLQRSQRLHKQRSGQGGDGGTAPASMKDRHAPYDAPFP